MCFNPEQAKKDAADRQAIVESLKEKLKQGDKALVGNKGYRKYLKRETDQAAFGIDEDKMQEEARYDGLWVLRTNTDYPAGVSRAIIFPTPGVRRIPHPWIPLSDTRSGGYPHGTAGGSLETRRAGTCG